MTKALRVPDYLDKVDPQIVWNTVRGDLPTQYQQIQVLADTTGDWWTSSTICKPFRRQHAGSTCIAG